MTASSQPATPAGPGFPWTRVRSAGGLVAGSAVAAGLVVLTGSVPARGPAASPPATVEVTTQAAPEGGSWPGGRS